MAVAEKLTEDYLTCIICSEVFTTPATLQCDHTFCRPCIQKYTATQKEAIAAKSIPCPVCKQMTKVAHPERPVKEWVSQLKSSPVIQGLIDDFGTKQEGGDTQKITKPFMCKKHDDEEIKLFCKVCQKRLCHICCNIDHKECKTIVSVKDILPDIRSKLLVKQQFLERKIAKGNTRITKRNSQIQKVQEESEQILLEIKSVSSKMMDLIQTKEQSLLEKLINLTGSQINKLQFQVERDEIDMDVFTQRSAFIDQSMKQNSLSDMFDMYESWMLDPGRTDEDVQNFDVEKITFKQDNESLRKIAETIHLGKIYITKAGDVGRETSPLLWRTISTRIPEDKTTPDISDIFVIEEGGYKMLIVADKNNSSIKSFSTHKCHTKIDVQALHSAPFGLTATRYNEVLVTLPHERKLIKAWFSQSISNGERYNGIYCLDQTKLVACREPLFEKPTVDVLDMEGNILKSFRIGNLRIPKFVCGTDRGTVLVTEDRHSSFIVIDLDGKVPHKYISTKEMGVTDPRGITTTSTGDILIVSMKGNKVIQLTESGDYVRDLVTSAHGLDKPHGIFIDKEGLLYVTCGECVKVFKFQ